MVYNRPVLAQRCGTGSSSTHPTQRHFRPDNLSSSFLSPCTPTEKVPSSSKSKIMTKGEEFKTSWPSADGVCSPVGEPGPMTGADPGCNTGQKARQRGRSNSQQSQSQSPEPKSESSPSPPYMGSQQQPRSTPEAGVIYTTQPDSHSPWMSPSPQTPFMDPNSIPQLPMVCGCRLIPFPLSRAALV